MKLQICIVFSPVVYCYTITSTVRQFDREFNVDWSAEYGQLNNLAHVTKKQKNIYVYIKEETNKNKHQCPLRPVEAQDPWRQSKSNLKDYGGKDLWKRWVLSLEWNVEAVIDGESEGGDCDEVICVGWGELGGQWTEWGWESLYARQPTVHVVQ